MRKITLFLFAFTAFCLQVHAQFTESFETEIPASWTVINGGGANGWVQSSSPTGGAQDGSGVASLTYNATAHNDYLITPAIAVTAFTNDRLSFFVKSRSSSFLEPYEVLLSTSDATEASFTTVLQASSNAPNSWLNLTFDLSVYDGQTVYVALRATGTNKFALYADNFVNDGMPSCTTTVVDNSIIVENCGVNQFSVEIEVASVGDGTFITDGLGGSFAIAAGTVTAGPYFSGTNVTLTVEHSDSACNFILGAYVFACPPANDECTDAISLTVNTDFDCSIVTSGTVAAATASGVDNCNGTPNDDVWYSFTATDNRHRVSLINKVGTTTDMYMVFYDATPGCGALGTQILCSDPDEANLTGLTIGTTYLVQVYTYSSSTGATTTFDICVGTPPAPIPGQLCETALVIGALPYTTTDNTSNYGDDYGGSPGASGCGTVGSYLNGDDVVYAYTATSDTSINVSMTPTATWSGIFVYTDCADIGVVCAQGVGNPATTERNFDLTVVNGTTYYFVISTNAAPQSTAYTLTITENSCTAATVNYAVVNDCAVSGGFFIDVNITNMGTATDLTISDNQGSATQALTAAGTIQFGPYVNATNVKITIEDDNDVNCTIESSVLTQALCPPANETCATATPIACGDSISGSSVGSTGTKEGSFICPIGNRGVWYTFIGDGGDITISVTSSFDIKLGIASGACGSLVDLGCEDDFNASGTEVFEINGTTLGETYYVYLAGWSSTSTTTGTHTIELACSTVSVADFASQDAFSYYPNPVSNMLNIKAQNNINNVSIYNMLGQEVLRTSPNAVVGEVDMSNLQTGAYFVKVTVGNTIETIRIIKN